MTELKRAISIKEENKQEIEKALNAVQGRAKVRLVTYEVIVNVLQEARKRLDIVTDHALEGTMVYFDNCESFPHAYKFTPESTQFKAKFSRGTWKLVEVKRCTCPSRSRRPYIIHLSETAKTAILKYYM